MNNCAKPLKFSAPCRPLIVQWVSQVGLPSYWWSGHSAYNFVELWLTQTWYSPNVQKGARGLQHKHSWKLRELTLPWLYITCTDICINCIAAVAAYVHIYVHIDTV